MALGKFCTVLKVMKSGHCCCCCCQYCYRPGSSAYGADWQGETATQAPCQTEHTGPCTLPLGTVQQCREVNAQGGKLANEMKETERDREREILPSFFPLAGGLFWSMDIYPTSRKLSPKSQQSVMLFTQLWPAWDMLPLHLLSLRRCLTPFHLCLLLPWDCTSQ